MKHFTTKRATIERQYQKVKAEIMQERQPCCAGCGTWQGSITFSHRIPRSRRVDLIAEKQNIDLMCPACHDKVETGRYDELQNGDEIICYIAENEPELLELKKIKQDLRVK
ncbi:MAG: hypothetical protein KDC86_19995 [Saprospiraceae bacterium]|nr:hypothetical protein [Saprospiraceae bacterium]